MDNIKKKKTKTRQDFQGYQMCSVAFRLQVYKCLAFICFKCLLLGGGIIENILDKPCSTGVLHIEVFHV